jgi:hypothetical protein
MNRVRLQRLLHLLAYGAPIERGGGERMQNLALERERESTKATINNYASISIEEGNSACGWLRAKRGEREGHATLGAKETTIDN